MDPKPLLEEVWHNIHTTPLWNPNTREFKVHIAFTDSSWFDFTNKQLIKFWNEIIFVTKFFEFRKHSIFPADKSLPKLKINQIFEKQFNGQIFTFWFTFELWLYKKSLLIIAKFFFNKKFFLDVIQSRFTIWHYLQHLQRCPDCKIKVSGFFYLKFWLLSKRGLGLCRFTYR